MFSKAICTLVNSETISNFFTNKALCNTMYLCIAYKYSFAWHMLKHVPHLKV